jgi:hypothetical protein
MIVCPLMSKEGKKVECMKTECAWWIPTSRGDCAVKAIPLMLSQVSSDMRMNPAGAFGQKIPK